MGAWTKVSAMESNLKDLERYRSVSNAEMTWSLQKFQQIYIFLNFDYERGSILLWSAGRLILGLKAYFLLYLPLYEKNHFPAHPFRPAEIFAVDGRMGYTSRRIIVPRQRRTMSGL